MEVSDDRQRHMRTGRVFCSIPGRREPMPPRSPSKHALIFIAITLLLDTIGFGLIIPVMPTLLVGITGKPVSLAAIDAGWLAFVYATMQFVCAPVLGNLSDRFGRRPVLLI